MKLTLRYFDWCAGKIHLLSNNESFVISIYSDGLERISTNHPQNGFDYDLKDKRRCVRIVGVDEI